MKRPTPTSLHFVELLNLFGASNPLISCVKDSKVPVFSVPVAIIAKKRGILGLLVDFLRSLLSSFTSKGGRADIAVNLRPNRNGEAPMPGFGCIGGAGSNIIGASLMQGFRVR